MSNNNWDSEKHLEELLEIYSDENLQLEVATMTNKPVKYKELLLYPIQLKFITFFYTFIECLRLRKNKSGDIEAIQMKYLDYIFYLKDSGEGSYYFYLKELLLLVLRCPRYKKNGDTYCESILFKKIEDTHYIIINNVGYDASDFLKIRHIICKQNDIELPNEKIHSSVERELEIAKTIEARQNKFEQCSIRELVSRLVIITHQTTEYLLNISILEFNDLISSYNCINEYGLEKQLSPNYKKEDIEKIVPWSCKPRKLSDIEKYTTDVENIMSKK